MHTDRFIEEIREIGKVLGLKEPLVIQGEELNEKGIGGIYGVGKASVHKPGNDDSVICSVPKPGIDSVNTGLFIYPPASEASRESENLT